MATLTPRGLARALSAGVTEAHVQRGCVTVLALYGWDVYAVGQRDARKTQTPGVSDLLAFHPVYGVMFVEVKRPIHKRKGDGLSDAQRKFRERAIAAGAHHFRIEESAVLRLELERIRTARTAPR